MTNFWSARRDSFPFCAESHSLSCARSQNDLMTLYSLASQRKVKSVFGGNVVGKKEW